MTDFTKEMLRDEELMDLYILIALQWDWRMYKAIRSDDSEMVDIEIYACGIDSDTWEELQDMCTDDLFAFAEEHGYNSWMKKEPGSWKHWKQILIDEIEGINK